MIAFLLPFLTKYWMQIGLGILIALCLGYVGILKLEVSHYKSSSVAAKLELTQYKQRAEENYNALKSSNSALTLALKQKQVEQNQAQETFNKTLKLKVINDEASKHIIVPSFTVKLLDQSAAGPSGGVTPDPDCGNACAPSATEADRTLNEVESVVTENNANHWQCITQVLNWQDFWKKYSDNVGRVSSGVPN